MAIVLCWMASAYAQTHTFGNGMKMIGDLSSFNEPVKKEPKLIFDTAHVKVYYELEFIEDTVKMKKFKMQTVLLQGDTHSLFLDRQELMRDSVYDDAVEKKKSAMEFMDESFSKPFEKEYEQVVLCDFQKGKTIIRENSWGRKFQYEEPIPVMTWSLCEGDTVINNTACAKATCHYRGRDYVAWYAKDIGLPLGPYLFQGLPGLVVLLSDTKGHYQFTLNGLDMQPTSTNIVFLTKNGGFGFMEGTREKMRAAIRKTKEFPEELLMSVIGTTMDVKETTGMKKGADPYNPIELE